MFYLYEGAARVHNPHNCALIDSADTEEEAKKIGEDFKGQDFIWYEEVIKTEKGLELSSLKMRPDLPPNNPQ